MILYPSNRKIHKLNARQLKKHHLGKFRKTSTCFKVKFKPGVSLENISDAYIAFIENLNLASMGFNECGDDQQKFYENSLSKVFYRKNGTCYTADCSEDDAQKVFSWLKGLKEVDLIEGFWIDDAYYSYLGWPDEDRDWFTCNAIFTKSRGKSSIDWYMKWFNQVNTNSLSVKNKD